MKISSKDASQQPKAAEQLRAGLAQRIAQFMGSAESVYTAIPGLAFIGAPPRRRHSPSRMSQA